MLLFAELPWKITFKNIAYLNRTFPFHFNDNGNIYDDQELIAQIPLKTYIQLKSEPYIQMSVQTLNNNSSCNLLIYFDLEQFVPYTKSNNISEYTKHLFDFVYGLKKVYDWKEHVEFIFPDTRNNLTNDSIQETEQNIDSYELFCPYIPIVVKCNMKYKFVKNINSLYFKTTEFIYSKLSQENSIPIIGIDLNNYNLIDYQYIHTDFICDISVGLCKKYFMIHESHINSNIITPYVGIANVWASYFANIEDQKNVLIITLHHRKQMWSNAFENHNVSYSTNFQKSKKSKIYLILLENLIHFNISVSKIIVDIESIYSACLYNFLNMNNDCIIWYLYDYQEHFFSAFSLMINSLKLVSNSNEFRLKIHSELDEFLEASQTLANSFVCQAPNNKIFFWVLMMKLIQQNILLCEDYSNAPISFQNEIYYTIRMKKRNDELFFRIPWETILNNEQKHYFGDNCCQICLHHFDDDEIEIISSVHLLEKHRLVTNCGHVFCLHCLYLYTNQKLSYQRHLVRLKTNFQVKSFIQNWDFCQFHCPLCRTQIKNPNELYLDNVTFSNMILNLFPDNEMTFSLTESILNWIRSFMFTNNELTQVEIITSQCEDMMHHGNNLFFIRIVQSIWNLVNASIFVFSSNSQLIHFQNLLTSLFAKRILKKDLFIVSICEQDIQKWKSFENSLEINSDSQNRHSILLVLPQTCNYEMKRTAKKRFISTFIVCKKEEYNTRAYQYENIKRCLQQHNIHWNLVSHKIK
jgi:hypothetical protein